MVLTTDELQEIDFDKIPQELKEIESWVLWKAVKKGDTYDKVPITKEGSNASSTNPNTWTTFEEVKKAHQSGKGSGIGIVLHPNNDLYVLDIDGTTDHELYEQFKHATYCETSPSGNGIHVYMLGRKPKQHRKRGTTDTSIELYSEGRFMTVTGHLCSELEDVTVLDSHLDNLISKEFKEEDNFTLNLNDPSVTNDLPQHDLSKEEVIKAMSKSQYKDDIASLMQGDASRYTKDDSDEIDYSKADWALISHLAYWTARNEKMMWEIFSESGLYGNERGKRPTQAGYDQYVVESIQKAVRTKKEVYKPKSNNGELLHGEALKKALVSRRFEELKRMEQIWEAEGKNGRKPTVISPNRCAVILQEYIKFVLFDIEENTKLSMYLADEGIYTRNTTLMYRVISWLEPTHDKYRADKVIYHIQNMSDIKEKTVSRYLIPVKNGVFNLETRQLEPFTPEYVFTTKIDTNYRDRPELPVIDGWNVEEWMKEIGGYDAEIVRLLWQVINDSLNGNYTRKKALFLVGSGNNGKGTYQELITNLIGSNNVATLKVNEFEKDFRIAQLEGKTAVIGDDVPPNVYIDDSSTFKSVVTGDRVSVEQKRQPVYSTAFKCTVIQSTNEMPKFRDKTAGVLRRFIIVPFTADFEKNTENFSIKEDYIKRKEVLEYVLYQAINMDFETFDIPQTSLDALDEFKQDNDPIYEFKTNELDMWDAPEVPMMLVYAKYRDFCDLNGYKAVGDKKFHKELKRHLEEHWKTDGLARFTEEKLERHFPNYKNSKYIDWNFPEKKPYRTYKNEFTKII